MAIFNKQIPLTPSWSLLRPSIELLRRNIWEAIYLYFLPSLFLGVGLVLADPQHINFKLGLTPHEQLGLIISTLAAIWSLIAYPAYLYFLIQAARGKEVTILESYGHGIKKFFPWLGMSIIIGVTVTIGLAAVIIPGLILIRGFLLAPYYLMDPKQHLGPMEALKQSYRATTPVSAWIWGVIGVEIVILVAGSIVEGIPVIGRLLSLAISFSYTFAPAMRYLEVVSGKKLPWPKAQSAERE